MKNFNTLQNTLPDLIKLLAILAYISIDNISRFIFKLKDSNKNHNIIVIGNRTKPSLDYAKFFETDPEKHKFTFMIDDLPKLFHKKIKVWPAPNEEEKDVFQRILYGSVSQRYTYVSSIFNIKFDKSETDSSFTIEQEIEINILSIYVLVNILKREVYQLQKNKKSADFVQIDEKIKNLDKQLKCLEKLKQYYLYEKYKKILDNKSHYDLVFEAMGGKHYSIYSVLFDKNIDETYIFTEEQKWAIDTSYEKISHFRHKKSRRRGSKSVKQRRKLRSKSKSRKLSPKIFRR